MWNFKGTELVTVHEKQRKNLKPDKFRDFKIHSHPGFQGNSAEQRLWMLKMLIAVLIKDSK